MSAAKKTQTTKTEENKKEHKYDQKIVVVGSGAFGTAIAESLVRDEDKNHDIVLFGINAREINDINNHNNNSKY